MNNVLLTFLEIIKYILPSLVLFGVTYVIIKQFLDENSRRDNFELKKDTANLITPIKLQAYERLILLLERISPQMLLINNNEPGCSATYLKMKLILAVNEEFNHNLSQQIYVSPQAWVIIKVVKENVESIIGTEYSRLPEGASGIDLGKGLIEKMMIDQTQPTQKAIDFIKAEMQLFFG